MDGRSKGKFGWQMYRYLMDVHWIPPVVGEWEKAVRARDVEDLKDESHLQCG